MHLRTFVLVSSIALLPRPAIVRAPVPALHGVITLTLGGSDETRDAYIFTQVAGTALAPDRRIIIHDGKTEQMRVFSADGKLIYVFGQPGKGPGDFTGACCMTFDAAGRMWVLENQGRRYSVMQVGAARAKFLWSVPMPVGQAGYTFAHLTWDRQHHLFHMGQSNGRGGFTYIRSTLDSAGRVTHVDTIPNPPTDSLAATYTNVVANGSSTYAQPFGASELMAQGPGGSMATAVSSRYAVRWIDQSGKLIAQINKPATGPLVSARERAKADSNLDATAARLQVTRGTIGLKVPALKPVLAGLFFDLDGRLWVQREVVDGAENVADVYGAGGVLLETVTWPAGVSLRDGTIHGNVALGRMRDEMGSQEVVRLEFRAN